MDLFTFSSYILLLALFHLIVKFAFSSFMKINLSVRIKIHKSDQQDRLTGVTGNQ